MVLLAATVAAVPLALVSAPDPAAAIWVPTGASYATPATWVDDAGRQMEVIAVGAPSAGTHVLVMARDLPSGVPDQAWGTDHPEQGLRFLSIDAPPAASLTPDTLLAASDDGVVTTTWRPSSCASAATCDRWFARYDGTTGATIGTPALVVDVPAPLRALRDGSLLTGSGSQPVDWFGPDGAQRGALPTTADALVGADVDPSGRLLALDATGSLARQAPGSAPDLDLSVECATTGHAAVGAAPDGGFAIACPSTASTPFTVERLDETGVVAWTSIGTAPSLPIGSPARVAVDALDRVWVGSSASAAPFPYLATAPVVVAAFDHTGPLSLGASRPTSGGGAGDQLWWSDLGGGIVDLRPVGDGTEVAYADHKVCCRYPNNTSAAVEARGAILPDRPSPPVCTRPTPEVRATAAGEVEVTFAPCTAGNTAQQPTSYRVVAAWGAGNTEVTIAASPTPAASLSGVPFGRRVGFAVVPSNAEGPTVGSDADHFTVLPFADLDSFVSWSVDHLSERDLTWAQEQALVAQVLEEDRTAAEVMTELLTGGAIVPRVEPVARLYLAAFLRDPDSGGLDYWARKRRDGMRLVDVAERFARSSEFVRRYGALSNRTFVQQVYRNVFGREGDPSGVAYWTRKLDAGTTRGTVLAQMSESSEHVMRTASVVRPMVTSYAMLGRRPTAAERADWIDDPDPYASVPVAILGSSPFLDRWFSPSPGP